ncbi:MAG: glutamine synthetase III [Clostridia bacterium]|nr:glutamine synthetase III [Clostridia bacterium]
MNNIPEIFGSMVFDDKAMKKRLPIETYNTLIRTIHDGKTLDTDIKNEVAKAMKDWAIEKGATHYTHWFQPLTGVTAEKHDSFITPDGNGSIIMEFSGRELIKGEPDASSFPSGGLRATFEARGYTAWDPTSYAFIKDDTLCIPTAFCSYGGESLDKKTPLLRSMEVINKQALRILRLFGNTEATRVLTTVGPEQEYFLIDKQMYEKREDLKFCDRTLYGAPAPKGQEKDDHYFGTIKPRVMAFMKELDKELWKLGVLAKTEHNEAAPAQHELAPIFTQTNIATDHNQLIMELMKKIADKHGLACLLHEKPFAGVNGSGKHNNWSLSTNTGENLLNPGNTPEKNAQFLLLLSAVIKAVDEYQDLLRVTVSSAGNDLRLGGNEAPPAIISMFLGDELSDIINSIIKDTSYDRKDADKMKIGAKVLPTFFKDTTDRNRTSPLAFTGNKFEFRMLGSSFSISDPNIVLNTTVAEVLDEFATRLESAEDFSAELKMLIKETLTKHSRIIFDGNNYSQEWVLDAEKRGLSNLKTTVDALPKIIERKNIELFTKYKIFTEKELYSRYEIMLDEYSKTIELEALTMLEMAKKDIIPAIISYSGDLSEIALSKKQLSRKISTEVEEKTVEKLSLLTSSLYNAAEKLKLAVENAKASEDSKLEAALCKDELIPLMNTLRSAADEAELMVSKDYWPFPTYGDLLFSI